MMGTFFEGTELNGIGDVRMHKQLYKDGEFIKNITVENKMNLTKGVDANYIEISTHANMTLWEFKLLVAKYTNSSPLCFNLRRNDINSKKPELNAASHCKLLSDLKFENDEKINAFRASDPRCMKTELLDEFNNTIPALQAIVS